MPTVSVSRNLLADAAARGRLASGGSCWLFAKASWRSWRSIARSSCGERRCQSFAAPLTTRRQSRLWKSGSRTGLRRTPGSDSCCWETQFAAWLLEIRSLRGACGSRCWAMQFGGAQFEGRMRQGAGLHVKARCLDLLAYGKVNPLQARAAFEMLLDDIIKAGPPVPTHTLQTRHPPLLPALAGHMNFLRRRQSALAASEDSNRAR